MGGSRQPHEQNEVASETSTEQGPCEKVGSNTGGPLENDKDEAVFKCDASSKLALRVEGCRSILIAATRSWKCGLHKFLLKVLPFAAAEALSMVVFIWRTLQTCTRR